MMDHCPLCLSDQVKSFVEFKEKSYQQDRDWHYFECLQCHGLFLAPHLRLKKEEEKQRYLEHKVDWDQYHPYLMKKWKRVLEFVPELSQATTVLDYGCGQICGIQKSLEGSSSPQITSYDKIFYPVEFFQQSYDIIFSLEVAEHFYQPHEDWNLWSQILKPSGWLFVFTQQPSRDPDQFRHWYYRKDPTHVFFYSAETWRWIQQKWRYSLEYMDSSLVVFKR